MRKVIFVVFILFSLPSWSLGQNFFNCDKNLLNSGEKFKITNPKSLAGTYDFTIVPNWDPEAERASVELHLFWENRYVELQDDSMHTPLVNHPLVGYTKGSFQNATSANFNEKMGQTDPFDPGIRYYADEKTLKSPGRSVDPSCRKCMNLSTDGPTFNFHIVRNIDGLLVGKWTEGFGIMKMKNSEGEWVNEATGFFCAKPKN